MSQDFSTAVEMSYVAFAEEPSYWETREESPRKVQTPDAPRKTLRLVEPPAKAAWLSQQERVDVKAEFRRLSAQLNERFAGRALLTQRLFSEEYTAIIGLGPRVVPFLLRDLQKAVSPWFWALRALTRSDPAKNVNPGDFVAVAACWIQWGKDQNIL
jgi:hypothetical protein